MEQPDFDPIDFDKPATPQEEAEMRAKVAKLRSTPDGEAFQKAAHRMLIALYGSELWNLATIEAMAVPCPPGHEIRGLSTDALAPEFYAIEMRHKLLSTAIGLARFEIQTASKCIMDAAPIVAAGGMTHDQVCDAIVGCSAQMIAPFGDEFVEPCKSRTRTLVAECRSALEAAAKRYVQSKDPHHQ